MTGPRRQYPYDVADTRSRPPAGSGPTSPDRPFDSRALTVDNPYKEPPPDAVFFTPIATSSLLAVVGNAATVDLVRLPDAHVGCIRNITFFVNDMLDTSIVDFSVLVNSSAIPGFSQSRVFPRISTSVSRGYDLIVRLPAAALVQANFVNQAAIAQGVGMQIFGWFFPQDVATRYDAERA